MSDLKDLEFLAAKSKEMVEKQVESYRQKHSNSGIIIGVIALFVPFFINGLENAYSLIHYFSLIPIGLLVLAIIIMLGVLRTKLLYQFFSVEKFKDLVNTNYEQILLYEIGANNDSFRDNKPIDEKVNRRYNFGIKITTAAIIISVSILLINIFFHPEKPPAKVQIQNHICMSDKDQKPTKPREIPQVPPKDRERLNEGFDRPQRPPQPPPKPNLKKD